MDFFQTIIVSLESCLICESHDCENYCNQAVNIYRLVSSGTIEEQILRLQQMKLKVAKAVVNSENSTMYSMGTDRLLDIFTTSSEMGATQLKEEDDIYNAMSDICKESEYTDLLSMEGFLSMLQS